MNLAGTICLVTGASSGIGRATALRLAEEGARVLAVGRDRRALEEVAGAVSGVAIPADLAVPAEIDRCAAEALEAHGRVDVLVNNAGIGLAGPFMGSDPKDADLVLEVDLLGPIRLTRALLPGMIQRRTGHVVNVASIAGHVGVRNEAIYAAAKAGLIAFGESLRYELVGTGVGVTVVSPGVVRTAFLERRGLPYRRTFPRPIPPERVADAIVHAVRRGDAHVFVPRWMEIPARLHGAWPGLYRRLAGRYG